MEIRKFQDSDALEVTSLVHEVYSEFNYDEGSPEATIRYLQRNNPKTMSSKELKEKYMKTPITYVAIEDKQIVGMIRGTKDQIINLYVKGTYHGKSIGSKLLETFEKDAQGQGSKSLTCDASLYATKFYEHRGYVKTNEVSEILGGLLVQPMRKDF